MNSKQNKSHRQKTANSFQFSRIMGSVLLILLILIAGVFLYRLIFPKSQSDKGSVVSLPLSQTIDKEKNGQQAKYTFYDNLKKKTSEVNNYEKPQPIITLESAKSSASNAGRPSTQTATSPVQEQLAVVANHPVGPQLMNPNQAETSSADTYKLQVGAFKNEDTAKRLQATMILEAYPAHIFNSNGVYRVQIGPYSSKSEADKVLQQLQNKGINTILKKN